MGRDAQESVHGQPVKLALLLISCACLLPAQSLPLEPRHDSGTSITGAFEGWFQNADGTYSLLLGYFNRNLKQELDIPIGPDNRIEPGGPDHGQPTHFLTGRQWGMFTIKVPADFGTNKFTWTIVANGQTMVIPASLKMDYEISPFEEASVKNTPPLIGFDQAGPFVQGPRELRELSVERTAKVGVPLPLTAWVSDDAKFTTQSGLRPKDPGPAVTVRWSKYRGPGNVVFEKERPPVDGAENKSGFSGKATTTAMFDQPGDYILHIVANDYSGEGGGGFQCCWTTAQLRVAVQQ